MLVLTVVGLSGFSQWGIEIMCDGVTGRRCGQVAWCSSIPVYTCVPVYLSQWEGDMHLRSIDTGIQVYRYTGTGIQVYRLQVHVISINTYTIHPFKLPMLVIEPWVRPFVCRILEYLDLIVIKCLSFYQGISFLLPTGRIWYKSSVKSTFGIQINEFNIVLCITICWCHLGLAT